MSHSKNLISKQQYKKLKNIMSALMTNETVDFQAPVPYQQLGLKDYLEIVKKPMDLGTINQRLLDNQYTFIEDILEDIQLVWDNCKLYNHHTTWIYKLAQKFQRNFKKLVKNYLPNVSVTVPVKTQKDDRRLSLVSIEPEEEELTYGEKIAFYDKLKSLNPYHLGSIIQKVMERYPHALKISDQNADLLVDNLERQAISYIQNQIQEQRNLWAQKNNFNSD